MQPKIKPCPFCGGLALLSHLSNEYGDEYCVSCAGELNGECAGLKGSPYYDTAEDAIRAWNIRSSSVVRPGDMSAEKFIEFLQKECERKQAQIDRLCDAIVGKDIEEVEKEIKE